MTHTFVLRPCVYKVVPKPLYLIALAQTGKQRLDVSCNGFLFLNFIPAERRGQETCR